MKKILETLKQKWVENLLEILVVPVRIIETYLPNNWNDTKPFEKFDY